MMRKRGQGPSWHERIDVLMRVLAAVFGGYVLVSMLTALLSLYLPMTDSEAVLTATMLSFLAYALAVMWAFAARSAMRAWIVLLALTAALAVSVFPPAWMLT